MDSDFSALSLFWVLFVPLFLEFFSSRPEGLSHADAERRLQEFGPHRVEELAREPLVLRLGKEFTQVLAGQEAMAAQGLHVLALAYRALPPQ